MRERTDDAWALVLAGGDGERLRRLTTLASGSAVPKQFCSLFEGPSLLQEALRRARTVTANARTCAVVARDHRRFWEPQLWSLGARNIIVQPQNRGTAIGVLLPLLHILERDPGARIVLLPSDHHVRDAHTLGAALMDTAHLVRWRTEAVFLLGIEPEDPDPELGYLVPGAVDDNGALTVSRFVEKPSAGEARELMGARGLWNSFILAAAGTALLELFEQRIPELVQSLRTAVQEDGGSPLECRAAATLYERLPTVDFSRDILMGQEDRLRVAPVPACGWSDLGTPIRVARALLCATHGEPTSLVRSERGCLSLAEQHQRIQAAQ